MDEYLKLLPLLKKIMIFIKNQLNDLDFILDFNIKPYKRTKEKMKEKNVPMKDLSDLVRGRLYFNSQYNFNDIEDILEKKLGKYIIKIEKKDEKESGLEYHGIKHVDMKICGINFELQLIPEEFLPYKDFLHDIYQKIREGKGNLILKQLHNKTYKYLDDLAKKNRN